MGVCVDVCKPKYIHEKPIYGLHPLLRRLETQTWTPLSDTGTVSEKSHPDTIDTIEQRGRQPNTATNTATATDKDDTIDTIERYRHCMREEPPRHH